MTDAELATNHERIWLEPRCNVDERAWCQDRLDDCDEPGCEMPAVEYVRADLYAQLTAQIAELKAALEDSTENGLIYWEPNTQRGAEAKRKMIERNRRTLEAKP